MFTEIRLNPKQVTKILAIIAICLFGIHIAMKLLLFWGGHDHLIGLAKLFDFDKETNIPTFYSSAILFLSFVLLAVIGIVNRIKREKFSYHWLGLSLIFLFLSFDEWEMVHERLVLPLRDSLHTSGLLYFPWVIPYGLAVIILMFVFYKFIFHLNTHTRFLFIISGTLYLSGTLFLEMVGGYYHESYGHQTVMYTIITTLEELLEVAGIIIFIYALLSYIQSEIKELRIKILD